MKPQIGSRATEQLVVCASGNIPWIYSFKKLAVVCHPGEVQI